MKAPPVAPEPRAENAIFTLQPPFGHGHGAAVRGARRRLAAWPRRPGAARTLYLRTLCRVRISLADDRRACSRSAFTTRYSGPDTTMGLAFASTGMFFPFFSPLIGWLGVALTGSDTASNVLFGNLQKVTAQQLGFSPILIAASNSSGGVMGKMIDAQSIVVASVATGQHGNEGQILRAVFWHSLTLASLVGLLVLTQAYWFPGVVP